jgi:hypothetical protein
MGLLRKRRFLAELCERLRLDSHRELRARIRALLVLTVAVDVVAMFLADALNEKQLPTRWLAFVWSTSQLLAGGSSLQVSSGRGHFLEIGLQLWGAMAVAALAGSFAAFFHRRSMEREADKKSLSTEGAEAAGPVGGTNSAE